MSGGIGVNPRSSYLWPVDHGPLGASNEANGDRENLKTYLKWLQATELEDKEALASLAAQFTFGDEESKCFEVNYLDGAFWPEYPEFPARLRVAAIDAITKALLKDQRVCTVLAQYPNLDQPWVNVAELHTEVLLLLALPAAPLDPS
jgi:hypothetical protein